MSKRARITVECEDSLHIAFVTRFLRQMGIPEGRDPVIRKNNGKAGVLDVVVKQVRATRNSHARAHLIFLVDGDNWKEDKTLDEVNKRLAAAREPLLSPSDPVLLIVVGRRMDTWIRHLRGEIVDEADHPGRKLDDNSEARSPAQTLADHCRNHRPLTNPLPSLENACRDWQTYCQRHGL